MTTDIGASCCLSRILEFCRMAYRKFMAEKVFDGYRFRQKDEVLITDSNGMVEAILPSSEAGDDVQFLRGILSPGFVNCHCHLELSHMSGLVEEGTGLTDFVYRVVTGRHLPEEEVLDAIRNADQAMWRSGISAVGDICNNSLTIPRKTESSVRYHNFIEASGFLPSLAATRFARSVEIFNQFEDRFDRNSIVPHAPYSVSPELWQLIMDAGDGKLMTIHNQETYAEDELFTQNSGDFLELYKKLGIDPSFFSPTGLSSLQTCLPLFRSNQPLILVHNVFTSADDLSFVQGQHRDQPVYWCFCPGANLYITDRLPGINLFTGAHQRIVLGTDSLASNHALSIVAEMKILRERFIDLQIDQLFTWATSNGAAALQMDDQLGSFEKGKKPGLVLSAHDLSGSERII